MVRHSSGGALEEYCYPSKHRAANLRFCQNCPWPLQSVNTQQPPLSQPLYPGGGIQRLCRHQRTRKLVPSSLSLRRRGSNARTQRRGDRGQPCRTERSIAITPERLPFTCTTAWGLWYIMLIHLRNSGLNPAVSKTDAKNRWSTLSKALDWSKLISAASVSSFIPSRTSRIKCRLSWIDLPFTAKVCSGADQIANDKL